MVFNRVSPDGLTTASLASALEDIEVPDMNTWIVYKIIVGFGII